ncbi:hypothetical protein AB0G00_23910 [Nocardia salmonicida]|uniref:hypothetical protein n=1 Tax=Nocardia salmonicida TaxID=53431 RepID=UPI0033C53748
MRVLSERATLRVEIAFELELPEPIKFSYFDRLMLPTSVKVHWTCKPGEDWTLWKVDINGPFVTAKGLPSKVSTSGNWITDPADLTSELRTLIELTRPDRQAADEFDHYSEPPAAREGRLLTLVRNA